VDREATRVVSGGRPRVAEALRAHASVICLQHPSLPPHSVTEQVSLKKKKKVSSTVLEATGNRSKPCSYYGLHRKGPIDLEKYKSDQGTSQK